MERINRLMASLLGTESRRTTPRKGHLADGRMPSFMVGQPVMVTRNDYNLRLFNGDVGVILPDRDRNNSLRVFFREDAGSMRDIGLSMLPEHETVYAMTVHKSQGSEFNRVLIILPDRDSPLLTRELLYTAITRAREKVEIWGKKEVFLGAINRRIKRTSGLAAKLWGED